MKRIVIAAALTLTLTGCAQFEELLQTQEPEAKLDGVVTVEDLRAFASLINVGVDRACEISDRLSTSYDEEARALCDILLGRASGTPADAMEIMESAE